MAKRIPGVAAGAYTHRHAHIHTLPTAIRKLSPVLSCLDAVSGYLTEKSQFATELTHRKRSENTEKVNLFGEKL